MHGLPKVETTLSKQSSRQHKSCTGSVTDDTLFPIISSSIVATSSESTPKPDNATEKKTARTPLPTVFAQPEYNLLHTGIHTSILKPGAIFMGFQESGMQQYKVEVKLIEVNLSDSTMAGLLTIHGLTRAYPVITTFFKGEIIGKNFTFETKHKNWGSNVKNDIQHWSRFQPWRALNLDLSNESNYDVQDYYYGDPLNNVYIFMRWKELFLYPDATITEIKGASFAGFYYICFNQLSGQISGLYFHGQTDKFQQLTLSFVPDRGVCSSYEYS